MNLCLKNFKVYYSGDIIFVLKGVFEFIDFDILFVLKYGGCYVVMILFFYID